MRNRVAADVKLGDPPTTTHHNHGFWSTLAFVISLALTRCSFLSLRSVLSACPCAWYYRLLIFLLLSRAFALAVLLALTLTLPTPAGESDGRLIVAQVLNLEEVAARKNATMAWLKKQGAFFWFFQGSHWFCERWRWCLAHICGDDL